MKTTSLAAAALAASCWGAAQATPVSGVNPDGHARIMTLTGQVISPADAVRSPVVFYAGGQFTPAQVAAMQPDQIAGVAQAVVAQEMVILGATRRNENGQGIAASPAHSTAAVRYARANRDALNAAYALIVDQAPPEVTPGNINDPDVLAEINRTAQLNALNARRRTAVTAGIESIARVVGTCNVLNCSDW